MTFTDVKYLENYQCKFVANFRIFHLMMVILLITTSFKFTAFLICVTEDFILSRYIYLLIQV